jgi:hypothetical protein
MAAVVVVGSLSLPAAAASAPAFSLTLFPAKVVLELGTSSVDFGLMNTGTDPQHVTVAPAAAWLVPDVAAFDLAAGQTHMTHVSISLPVKHDSGDIDSTITFSAASGSAGMIRVSRGLAAVVIVSTNQNVTHGLTWSGLKVPSFIDPMSGPVRLNVRASNAGNVHELLDPVLGSVGAFPWENITDSNDTVLHWTPTILLRDSSRVLQADWSPPAFCWCTVAVRGQEANVLVVPVRALGLVVLGLGLVLVAGVVRRRRAK